MPPRIDTRHVKGLRTVALFEFAKGLLVLLAGFGLLSLARSDKDIEDLALSLLYVLHIDPVRHFSQVFLRAAARLDDVNLVRVAAGAAVYSILRFVEAYGLWKARVWAEWLALLSGAIYLPLEVYELVRKQTPIRWGLFTVNLIIVIYLAYVRLSSHREHSATQLSRPRQVA